MKCFFTFLLLLPFIVKAQDSTLVITEKDKFTDQVTYSSKYPFNLYDKKNILEGRIIIVKSQGSTIISVYIIVSSNSFGCTDEKQTIYFLFDDNTKLQTLNKMRFNCKGENLFFLNGGVLSDDELDNSLFAKNLSAIRIHSISDVEDFDIDKKDGILLNKTINEFRKIR